MDNKSNKQEKPKKRKVPRCKCILENGKKCKKKLTPVDLCITCKCGMNFCPLHRSPEKNNCKITEIIAKKDKEVELDKVLGGGLFKQLEVI